jgi:hypothetical protein
MGKSDSSCGYVMAVGGMGTENQGSMAAAGIKRLIDGSVSC